MSRVVVFGGYGTFGGRVSRQLARYGLDLLVAGRDARRAVAFAAALGANCRAADVDVTDRAACRALLTRASVGVHCAGPFAADRTAVLDACLDTGCHYVDIADDRGYVGRVRELGPRFAERRLGAVYGCSSLPGISGALALRAMAGRADGPDRARVTLFIGNDNPKGHAAIASMVAGVGRRIAAPQGTLRGFRDREVVPLPPPFGPRPVFNFDSPEYDEFPHLLGVRSVTVKLGFELRTVTYAFALLARLPLRYGARSARLLGLPGGLVRGIGTSGAAVMCELFSADTTVRRAAVVARHDGQRMAALPCAYVVRALLDGATIQGAATAYEVLGADRLLDLLVADGYELVIS